MQEIARYIRVTRASWPDLAPVDGEAGRQVLHDLVAALRRLPGNQSSITATDHASGHAVAVSTRDSEEHAPYSAHALGDVASRLWALGLQIEPTELFQVDNPGAMRGLVAFSRPRPDQPAGAPGA